MPRGDKSKYTEKQKRKVTSIAVSQKKRRNDGLGPRLTKWTVAERSRADPDTAS
jgi:hypothetical protein